MGRKIVAKFFKYLIKKINNELGLIGIKKRFKFLPAKFIYKYIIEVIKEKNKSNVDFQDKENLYNYILKVLNCLRNSKINIFEKKKFSQIFGEY